MLSFSKVIWDLNLLSKPMRRRFNYPMLRIVFSILSGYILISESDKKKLNSN